MPEPWDDQLKQARPGAQLADQLALCLTARIAVALKQPPSGGDDPAAHLERLRQLCMRLVALRKGDHHAQWLQIERAKLELQMKKYKEEAAARKRERKRQEKEDAAGPMTKESWEEIERALHLL